MPQGKRHKSKATLVEVAAEAGVSTITASRALRGQGPISDTTRAKVLKAAEKLGYRRNPLAASLVSQRTDLVGVIVPSLSNIVFVDVLAGVNDALAETGYRSIFGVTDYAPEEEARLVDGMLGWHPAALILTGVEHDPATRAAIEASGTACIEIMDMTEDPIGTVIGFSHVETGHAAARRLIEKGYRRIAYLGHSLTRDTRAAKRYAGFRAALAEAGVALHAEEITSEASGVGAGRAATGALLARAPDVDAIYFSNDDMAIGGLLHCLAAGLDVPGQIAAIGFNGLEIGQEMPSPLTTMLTPRREIGLRAGRAALALASGQSEPARQVVEPTFIPGKTI